MSLPRDYLQGFRVAPPGDGDRAIAALLGDGYREVFPSGGGQYSYQGDFLLLDWCESVGKRFFAPDWLAEFWDTAWVLCAPRFAPSYVDLAIVKQYLRAGSKASEQARAALAAVVLDGKATTRAQALSDFILAQLHEGLR